MREDVSLLLLLSLMSYTHRYYYVIITFPAEFAGESDRYELQIFAGDFKYRFWNADYTTKEGVAGDEEEGKER